MHASPVLEDDVQLPQKKLCVITTAPEIPQPAQLHAIAEKLEEDGTYWTRLVKD